MKVGFRTPSVSKRISARTTGRITRSINRASKPLYGKKGMGLINDPKRAVYNKVYNQTTLGFDSSYDTQRALNDDGGSSFFLGCLLVLIIFFVVLLIFFGLLSSIAGSIF